MCNVFRLSRPTYHVFLFSCVYKALVETAIQYISHIGETFIRKRMDILWFAVIFLAVVYQASTDCCCFPNQLHGIQTLSTKQDTNKSRTSITVSIHIFVTEVGSVITYMYF